MKVARDILTGRGRFKNSISNVSVRELIASQPGPLLLIRQRSNILSLRIIFTHTHTHVVLVQLYKRVQSRTAVCGSIGIYK